jgi:hypothetical protein
MVLSGYGNGLGCGGRLADSRIIYGGSGASPQAVTRLD